MFKDLVLKNRSCRGFDAGRAVTREELLYLADCARLAASSGNVQPLKYYLVSTKEEAARIQPLTKWAAALPDMTLPHPDKCPPAFIVICQDEQVDSAQTKYLRDVGIAAQTILLAATEQGLGGCMIGNFHAGKLSETLGLAQHIRPMLVIAIGAPDETIILAEAQPDGNVAYYRDENGVHYVPKRRLADVIL